MRAEVTNQRSDVPYIQLVLPSSNRCDLNAALNQSISQPLSNARGCSNEENMSVWNGHIDR